MEVREDLNSILSYLPLSIRSSDSFFWPAEVVQTLRSLSLGPNRSGVTSGRILFQVISNLRRAISLTLPYDVLHYSAADGYARFFNAGSSDDETGKWMGQVIPAMAGLLLRLPSLLEDHYQNSDLLLTCNGKREVVTGLRLLESQKPGIVFLSQELIGALLGCSFFCLFPVSDRFVKQLQTINFDHLFANLASSFRANLEQKVRCIMNYFERICSSMPTGMVSFERKVLPLGCYPKVDEWRNSVLPLCKLKVQHFSLFDDQSCGAMEVDFANEYLGGGALRRGCAQEEIHFMTNPELIIGMLFLPRMDDNESIEVVGAERFSGSTGCAATFRFLGNYVDKRERDVIGRLKSRIIAIDALCTPGTRQFTQAYLLRELNKAFCGFQDGFNYGKYQKLCQEYTSNQMKGKTSRSPLLFGQETSEDSKASVDGIIDSQCQNLENDESIGIATGNWGYVPFGGDPELKVAIQWLAASQAKRPFIIYHVYGMKELTNLKKFCERFNFNGWTVGMLWRLLVDYSSKRLDGRTLDSFCNWVCPS